MIYQVDSFDHTWSIRTSMLVCLERRIKKSHFSRKGNSLGGRQEYTGDYLGMLSLFANIYKVNRLFWECCSLEQHPWVRSKAREVVPTALLGDPLLLQSWCPFQAVRKHVCRRSKGFQVWAAHMTLVHTTLPLLQQHMAAGRHSPRNLRLPTPLWWEAGQQVHPVRSAA